jgi:hypothetical protein
MPIKGQRGQACGSLIECMLNMCDALCLIPSTIKKKLSEVIKTQLFIVYKKLTLNIKDRLKVKQWTFLLANTNQKKAE